MNFRDPKLTVLQFNECITNHDVESLSRLMTDNHKFIDSAGNIVESKENIVKAWIEFFAMFPDYKNTFHMVKSEDNLVIIVGYAYWSEENKYDEAIWTAKIENDLVAEWCIYYDTKENRDKFQIKD